MDSNIDPTIEMASPLRDASFAKAIDARDDVDAIDTVFHLNEYMKNGDSDTDRAPAEDAQLLINFGDTNDNIDQGPEGAVQVAQMRELDPASAEEAFQVVSYDPDKKVPRLGRPRRQGMSAIKASQDESSKNLEEASVSRFRLDNKPVEGPGSRGGNPNNARKHLGRLTSETLRKKKQKQATLNLKSAKLQLESNDKARDSSDNDLAEVKSEDSSTEKGSIIPKSDSTYTSRESTPKPDSRKGAAKKPQPKTVLPISRTTMLNSRNKITRQFPGPIVPLYYDLYDENTMKAPQNREAASEKLAFGFPVKQSHYASDIIYLVSYLERFRDLIGLGFIGPQDIEEGLSLPPGDASANFDASHVSYKMIQLFARLTTLVLNRKPEVNPKFQGKPIMELKAVCVSLGLPSEWRDPEEVYQKVPLDPKEAIPVDESYPEILLNECYIYHHPFVVPNPFTDKTGFEKLGFQGIENPVDRLIMLRTLAQWSLISSNEIKALITQSIQGQDYPGDKETYYAARSVLNGIKHTEDITHETNTKIAKKNYKPDNEMVAKYVEPISDPMEHNMRLRINEAVVGDCGFNIGRFYFSRAADADTGGLASVKKMVEAWSNPKTMKNKIPSSFKLYVQDVHSLLVNTLQSEGIEFDEDGNEVETTRPPKNEFYYEVASNTRELEKFLKHLDKKLNQDEPAISPTSLVYKPALHLYEYLAQLLPLLQSSESLHSDDRASRKRQVDHSEPRNKKAKKEDLTNEEYIEDDYELEEIPNHEDEDDEDYMDS